MAKKSICSVASCKRLATRQGYCSSHKKRVTTSAFLGNLYSKMLRRTKGKDTKNPHLYVGKTILPREVFKEWSMNHPHFLSLYKRWVLSGYDRKLAPSVNRMDSKRGYTLDNIEWVTFSQNASLAGTVRSFNGREAVYKLLGGHDVQR
jgi:hypothetical protein